LWELLKVIGWTRKRTVFKPPIPLWREVAEAYLSDIAQHRFESVGLPEWQHVGMSISLDFPALDLPAEVLDSVPWVLEGDGK
jgi:hypothetical protein